MLLFRIFTSSQTLRGGPICLIHSTLFTTASNLSLKLHFSFPFLTSRFPYSLLPLYPHIFFFRRASPWRVPPCTRIPDLPRDTLSCRTPQAAILLIVPLSFGSKNAQRFRSFPPGVARCGRIAARPARQKLELYPSPVITICTPGGDNQPNFMMLNYSNFRGSGSSGADLPHSDLRQGCLLPDSCALGPLFLVAKQGKLEWFLLVVYTRAPPHTHTHKHRLRKRGEH